MRVKGKRGKAVRRLRFRTKYTCCRTKFDGKLFVCIIGIKKYRLLLWVFRFVFSFEGGWGGDHFAILCHGCMDSCLPFSHGTVRWWYAKHFELFSFLFVVEGGELLSIFLLYPSLSTFVERQRSWRRELRRGR
jgi:hypothetical protein